VDLHEVYISCRITAFYTILCEKMDRVPCSVMQGTVGAGMVNIRVKFI
jgi:hypothetical protein